MLKQCIGAIRMDLVNDRVALMDGQSTKKAVAYIFSGTGNTLIAGKMLQGSLPEYGISLDIYQITTDLVHMPDPNAYDLAFFAYPIHAFNSPQFFLHFVKNIPSLNEEKSGMPAYIFKTSGEPFRPNNASSYSLCHILRKKGFQPASDMHMLMPYNIMFRYPDAMAKQMYIHTRHMAGVLAEKAGEDLIEKPSFNPVTVIWAYLLRLQWFGAWVNGPLIKAKADLCTSCGKCVKNCPADNITMVQKMVHGEVKVLPKFGGKCTMCMCCTMDCPTGAINPGFLTPWKVNGAWDFDKLMADDSIPDNWTDNENAKYFKLFRNYYRNT